jgi:hypothetical protein
MKIIILSITLAVISLLASCQSRQIYLSISSKDTGWVYIVKSKTLLSDNTFTADSNRIIYVPASFFEKGADVTIKVDGVVPKSGGNHTMYSVEFYPESGPKITYSKFYFPIGREPQNEKVYSYNNRQMQEFEYFYESGRIDRRVLVE